MEFFKNNIGLSLFFVFFAISFCVGQPIDIADHPFTFADGFADPAPEGLLPNPALLYALPKLNLPAMPFSCFYCLLCSRLNYPFWVFY